MTNQQFVSSIWGDLKATNIDMWLSPKFILSKGKDISGDFMKKDNEARRIWKLQEGWYPLECLQMREVPVTECAELDTYVCQKLMKSLDKIPTTFSSRYGNFIKYVSSVNFGVFYEPKSPKEWKAIQKREFQDKTKRYYFFIDNYLYIPIDKKDPIQSPESIRLEALFRDQIDAARLNLKNSDCSNCDRCLTPLDFQFVCPEYLLDDVKKELLKQLSGIYLQVKEDSLPNMNPLEPTNPTKIG